MKKSQGWGDQDLLVLSFDVDPCRGFAAMISAVTPEGYYFVSMTRKGTKAKATFRKIPAKTAQA